MTKLPRFYFEGWCLAHKYHDPYCRDCRYRRHDHARPWRKGSWSAKGVWRPGDKAVVWRKGRGYAAKVIDVLRNRSGSRTRLLIEFIDPSIEEPVRCVFRWIANGRNGRRVGVKGPVCTWEGHIGRRTYQLTSDYQARTSGWPETNE